MIFHLDFRINLFFPSRELEKKYKDLEKAREAKRKQTQSRFRDMNNKWKASDKLVRFSYFEYMGKNFKGVIGGKS